MAASTRELVNVVQLGPGLQVRGGVSSVERLIVEHVGAHVSIRHIPTVEDGSLWRKLWVFARALRDFRRVLRSKERLIVHIHFASRGSTLRKMILAWMASRAGQPLILHAHGASFDKFFASLPRIVQLWLQRTFRRADYLLVLSSQWRDFFTRQCGMPAGRVLMLYNATAIPARVPDRAGRHGVQFLFLGRIGQRKGAFDLLEAYRALPGELRARTRLVFAGDGEVDTLRQRAASFGEAVEIHAWIDAATRDALLAASDVFVLPSYHEGLPMALLEAMAHGLPVITTPVGGIPDVVTHECEGLIVEPGDRNGLHAAMCAMIRSEQRRLDMGRHARCRAERFDIGQYAADLIRLYRQLLAAR